MQRITSKYLILGFIITLFLFSGCSPEEGDLIPPDATVDGGIESPRTDTTITMTGTVESGALILVEVGADSTAVITDLTQGAGVWSCTAINMSEGANTFYVYATDLSGNTRFIQVPVIVDLTGPVTTVDQYPESAQTGTFSFAGTVDEAGSAVFVEATNSSAVVVDSGTAFVDADIWSISLNLLADDTYTITATGTDRLGNISAAPASQSVTVSAANPSFAIVTPSTRPVVLSDPETDAQVLFDGNFTAGSSLDVSATTGVVGPINITDPNWNTDVSALASGNTVITFDVNSGATVQKVLVVRDLTAPTVVEWDSITTSSVSIEFNESMNPATILPENLTVVDSTDTTIAYNVLSVVQDDDRTFTFTTDLLPAGGAYTATLQVPLTCSIVDGCKVEDGRGNSLAASYVWRFNK